MCESAHIGVCMCGHPRSTLAVFLNPFTLSFESGSLTGLELTDGLYQLGSQLGDLSVSFSLVLGYRHVPHVASGVLNSDLPVRMATALLGKPFSPSLPSLPSFSILRQS